MDKRQEAEQLRRALQLFAATLSEEQALVIAAGQAGTVEDPIPAARGMEYEYGKYYRDPEDGKTYLCQRTGEAEEGKVVLQYLPHELTGQYFTEV